MALELGPLARARKFGRNVKGDIAACPRGSDKIAVALADARRAAQVLAGKLLGPRAEQWAPSGPYRDVLVSNIDGRFLCRRATSDYSIVRLDYEAALRPEFRLNGGVFVDVGAQIGKYSVSVGRQLQTSGRVIAIEPEPDNFAALERNIAENQLTNVTPLNVACGATRGEATLYRDSRETILHSLKGDGPGITVPVRPLDELLEAQGLAQVQLLKVDAEGVECDVLIGALETLRRSPEVRIVIEANDAAPLDFLRDLGFIVARTAHSFGQEGWYYTASRPSAKA